MWQSILVHWPWAVGAIVVLLFGVYRWTKRAKKSTPVILKVNGD